MPLCMRKQQFDMLLLDRFCGILTSVFIKWSNWFSRKAVHEVAFSAIALIEMMI
jgi:hypothetical protein